MSELAHKIDSFLNEIILKAENQHEIPSWFMYE